jgi:hypothetical protein
VIPELSEEALKAVLKRLYEINVVGSGHAPEQAFQVKGYDVPSWNNVDLSAWPIEKKNLEEKA